MNVQRQCPECGADLSDESPDTPCLACLMKIGLRTWQDQVDQNSLEFVPETVGTPASRSLPSPEELAEQFPGLEILELLGQGGMGAVFKARQTNLDRYIALKVITEDAQNKPHFADRFSREAKALARLNHPNIVTVHDFGRTDSFFYLMMEFVDGVNLRELLRSGEVEPATALGIVPAVCEALQYAHDEGIVHRDIKPENILIDQRGRVKIADFGLAKLLDDTKTHPNLTKTNQVMGTLHYMAPEQVEKPLTVDHRADIYSLGVVFYELLTGELPLGRFAPPSQKVHVDVRLDEIVMHTLEKEPGLRYQRVGDVKTDMESIHTPPVDAGQAASAKRHGEAKHEPKGTANNVSQAHPLAAAPQPSKPAKPAMPPSSAPKPLAEYLTAENLFGVVLRPQTYLNIGYLLASFPLGVLYFVVLVTGLSVGLGTLIIWIGFFVLLGTLIAVKGFAEFERIQAERILGQSIPTRHRPSQPPSLLGKVKALLTDYSTWTAMLFALLKFPLGIVSFVLVVTLLATSLALTSSLALYAEDAIEFTIGDRSFNSPIERVMISLAGVVLGFVSLHIFNGMAWLNGQLARLCLRRSV